MCQNKLCKFSFVHLIINKEFMFCYFNKNALLTDLLLWKFMEFRITDSVYWLKQSLSIFSISPISSKLSYESHANPAGQIRNWYPVFLYRPCFSSGHTESLSHGLMLVIQPSDTSYCIILLLQVVKLLRCEQGQFVTCSLPLQIQRIV